MHEQLSRRDFLRRAANLGAGMLAVPSLLGLAACSDVAGPVRRAIGYGPLTQHPDVPELWVPRGFMVQKLSTTGERSLVNPDLEVAYGVDGMAVFSLPNGNIRLVRNHEIRDSAGTARLLGPGRSFYDGKAGGGTSTLELRRGADGAVELVSEFISLSGTHTNCAGGPTPWGSWITCEETTAGTQSGFNREHGYCFEVPAAAHAEVEPVPLRSLGRFVHEAVAVDPVTGFVYLTEDMLYDASVPAGKGSGFYRFLPEVPGDLKLGGRLQMLRIRDQRNYVAATGQVTGSAFAVDWVDIYDADPADAGTNPSSVFQQGWANGAAAFERLEGCWYGDGTIYFNSTSGGNARAGQVWAYSIREGDEGVLRLLFESPSTEVLDSPDNLCVSPRGGLAICEDGEGIQYIRGLTPDGLLFDFVRTHGASAEFAGACFSADGRTFFFNIQGGTRAAEATRLAGGTYAMWGPWEAGAL